ncbi:MAG: hypothetical protein E7604_01730 [Ruminococcaceae bacterium]|nr:hypothetical protein [Oscillospiraceae bacterium]
MKTMTTALLLTAMLTASLASCGDAADSMITPPDDLPADSNNTIETSVETEEPDALEQRMLVDDGLPEQDFGGRTFRILGDEEYEDYYIMQEETGDVLDDAIFLRNAVVSERFNVVIEANVIEEGRLTGTLKNSVMAGDDEYQLFAGHIIYAGNAVSQGIYYNWYDMPHIDFTKPWWSQSTVEDLTYDDKAFLAMGDFALSTVDSTYCMYYNKQIAAEYDLPDMYALVNDGKWTIDTLAEYTKQVYKDLNGNGQEDDGDLYGFAMWPRSPVNVFLWAFGEKLGKKQDDGTVVMDYFNEKVIELYQKLIDFCWNTEGTFMDLKSPTGSNTQNIAFDMFLNNQVLFQPNTFKVAATALRDFETDYGIIPYPKWDEAQDAYYTMVDGGHEGLAIPLSVGDLEFTGILVEALNAESYKRTVPTFYDIVLKAKGSRDEESVAMLDMIFDGRVFDFGYVFGEFGAAFWPQYLVEQKSADITSYYERNHLPFDKRIEKAIKFFEEYES